MPPKHRNSYEVMRDILNSIQEPKIITRIVNNTNSGFTQLKKHLKVLEGLGYITLINHTDDKRTKIYYQITESGKTFLEGLNKVFS